MQGCGEEQGGKKTSEWANNYYSKKNINSEHTYVEPPNHNDEKRKKA